MAKGGINILIKSNIDKVTKRMTRDLSRTVRKAAVLAVNDTAKQTKTKSKKVVTRELNVKSREVTRRIHIKRARMAATLAAINAELIYRWKPIKISEFKGARQTKRGVAVRVKKRRLVIKGGFKARLKNSGLSTFVKRSGKVKSRRGPKGQELPISVLYSTNVRDIMRNRDANKEVTKFAAKKYPIVFRSKFNFLFSKLR